MRSSNARMINWQHKAVCLLTAALLVTGGAHAQLSLKRQRYDSIAARYKGEHAVYTEFTERLEIKEEDNKMIAIDRAYMEKLFISDRSLNMFNEDPYSPLPAYLFGGEPDYTPNYDATIYLPEGNDYRSVKNTDKNGRASFEYSGLKKNAVTVSRYHSENDDLRHLGGFFFSQNIPVLNSTFEVTAPKNVKMGFFVTGGDTSIIRRSVEERNGKIIYRFTASNVPADKHYGNVPSARYYMPHVYPYVVSFRLTGAKKDSVLTGSNEAHQKFEYAYVKGMNYEQDSFLNKKTAELTRYAYSDRDKAKRIYDWVQKNFHYQIWWNDVYKGGNVPHQADTVCDRMFGDCKDMSSVIVAMCRKAGVPAYFAVIGTTENNYTHEDMQLDYLYNHMICAAKIDGQWVFLDGTTHVMPMGANRDDIQGKEAYIMLDDTRYEVVKIPIEPATRSTVTTTTTMNVAYGGDVTGSMYRRFTGYEAWDMGESLNRLNRKDERDEYIRSKMRSGNNKFLIDNYNISRSDEGNKDISVNASYHMGNYATQVKKDYYVNMNLYPAFSDMLVSDEDRKVPLYFDYKKTIKATVTMNIPKGARVSAVPKPVKGGLDGKWSYSISYKTDTKAGTITMTREIVVNTLKIDPSDFEAHNKQVNALSDHYKETVVLTAK